MSRKKFFCNLQNLFFSVFSNIEAYAPGFKDSVVGVDFLAPPDLERIFGLTGGVNKTLTVVVMRFAYSKCQIRVFLFLIISIYINNKYDA